MSNEELPNDFGQAKHLIEQSIHIGEIRRKVDKLKEQGAPQEEQLKEYFNDDDMTALVQEVATVNVLKDLLELAGFPFKDENGYIRPAWEGHAMNIQGMVEHPTANQWRHLVLKKYKKVRDILQWLLDAEEISEIGFTNEIENLDYTFFATMVLEQDMDKAIPIIARNKQEFDEKKTVTEASVREMLKKDGIDPDNPPV